MRGRRNRRINAEQKRENLSTFQRDKVNKRYNCSVNKSNFVEDKALTFNMFKKEKEWHESSFLAKKRIDKISAH